MRGVVFVAALLAPSIVSAQPAQTSAQQSDNEIICKREAEVGSLVRKKKTCLTRAEWKRVAEGAREAAGRLAQDGLGGSHCKPSLNPNDPQC